MVLTNFGLAYVPQAVVLLVEEDLGDTKTVFFQNVVAEALKTDKRIYFISTKYSTEDVLGQLRFFGLKDENMDGLTVVGNFTDPLTLLDICYKRKKLCDLFNRDNIPLHNISELDIFIIDSFSSLFLHEDLQNLTEALQSLISISRETDTTFLLAADMGILSERSERITRSMVDGIIQFRNEYLSGKISRYINIPKMKGTLPMNKMMAYNITNQGIMVDTRERVG
ncbi:MAG: hypothetical protein JW705_09615 [Methanosarcinaceae archaeon]|nr:hypothetical protein [Methanosarcinaceae archaeon]